MEQSPLDLIRARRAEIAKARKALDQEEAELMAAERTIVRLTGGASKGANGAATSKPTQKEMVIGALKAGPVESIRALQAEIARIYGIEVKLTSLQPLVSFMTGKELVRDGRRVALAE